MSDLLGSLFPTNSYKPQKASHEDYVLAKQLMASLAQLNRITKKPNINIWATEFRKLRQQFGEEVFSILDWYCRNIKNKYTPSVYSASQFRAKYLQIKNVKSRDTNTNIEITLQAKHIHEQLSILNWSKGSSKELLYCIQISLNNLSDFYNKLYDLIEPFEDVPEYKKPSYIVVAEKFIEENQITNYVRNWFERVHRQTCNWADWNGSLKPYIISCEHKDFIRHGQTTSISYSGDDLLWDTINSKLQ